MIGQLRHRVGVYIPQETADGVGGKTTQWAFAFDCWTDVQPRSVSETGENGRLSVTKSYRLVIRHRDNFPERARLMWGERILRLVAASDPDTRRERLHLICEEETQ